MGPASLPTSAVLSAALADRRVRRQIARFGPSLALLAMGAAILSGVYFFSGSPAGPHSDTTTVDGAGPSTVAGAQTETGVPSARRSKRSSTKGESSASKSAMAAIDHRTGQRDAALSGLLMPVAGVRPSDLRNDFADSRSGGRSHQAIDIMAPRGTPVLAAADGTVAKLFESKLGGTTIYIKGTSGEYMYYYAHLDRYARGLSEGATIKRGQRIATVGSTGNAPESAPHLHFAIYRLAEGERWWQGTPINPYALLARIDTFSTGSTD